MREIKFRAWDIVDKKFGYFHFDGYRIVWCDKSYSPFEIYEDGTGVQFNNYETVQQYTGLKDKNGKEIYEGDIVTTESAALSERLTKTVEFGIVKDVACIHQGFGLRGFSRLNGSPDNELHSILGWDIEVIGNIYENPELLED